METQLASVENVHTIKVCPHAPRQAGAVWVDGSGVCPYCLTPLADHEEFLSVKFTDAETPVSAEASDAAVALDLLRRWYLRWQGHATDMTVPHATKALLVKLGRGEGL